MKIQLVISKVEISDQEYNSSNVIHTKLVISRVLFLVEDGGGPQLLLGGVHTRSEIAKRSEQIPENNMFAPVRCCFDVMFLLFASLFALTLHQALCDLVIVSSCFILNPVCMYFLYTNLLYVYIDTEFVK